MNDLPAQLRNIQDHLRTGRFGQREIWGRQLGDAASQIERLRAALESLTEDPPATLDEPDTDCEVILKMRAIARAALDHD